MASAASDDAASSKTYKAAFVMPLVSDIPSLLAQKKEYTSSAFTCPDDPFPTSFKMNIDFGKGKDNFMSTGFINTNRNVTVTAVKFSVCDKEMKVVWEKESNKRKELCLGIRHFQKAFCLHGFGAVDWRVNCEIDYVGIEDIDNIDHLKEYMLNLVHMSRDMLTLLDNPENADITLNVSEEKIKAHRNILAARSPFFRSMFQSGMKESRADEILINDVEPTLFREALRFIYSGKIPTNMNDIALQLYPVADKFLIDDLKESCSNAIRNILSTENIIDALALAEAHNENDLFQFCLPFFKANVKTLKNGNRWDDLKKMPNLLVKLLEFCCD